MNYTVFTFIIIKTSHRSVNISEVEKIILCPKPEFLSGVRYCILAGWLAPDSQFYELQDFTDIYSVSGTRLAVC